jgi:hypothetical protein
MSICIKVVSTSFKILTGVLLPESSRWFLADTDLFLPSVMNEPSILTCELNYWWIISTEFVALGFCAVGK